MQHFLLRPRPRLAVALRLRLAPFALTALSLPFAGAGGCSSRTACFAFSAAQFNQQNGCPAQKDALANFTDPHCPGGIVSVDGAGSFDGQLCCYQVTYDDIVPDCGSAGGAGTGAFPGDVGTGTGTIFGTTAVSSSGGPSCSGMSCAQTLVTGTPPCGDPGATFLTQLQTCACNGSQNCLSDCITFCDQTNGPVDPSCSPCLQTNCAQQLMDCQNN